MKKLLTITAALLVSSPCYAQRIVLKGATDQSVDLLIIDEATGVPETGVLYNTSGIDLWYRRPGAVKTSITEATLAALTTAHADGGFLEIGNGLYRLDLPDAAVASGVDHVLVGGTVTGMIVRPVTVQLAAFDMQTAIQSVNATQWLGTALATPDTAGYPKVTVKSGTGTGEISTASGRAQADVRAMIGTVISNDGSGTFGNSLAETFSIFFGTGRNDAGAICAAVDVGSIKVDTGSIKTRTDRIPNIAAGAAGGLLIAGSNEATTFATLTSTGAMSINGVGHVAQTGDSFARLGSNGAGLTALPWNAAWDAEAQSEANDALVANKLDRLLLAAVTGADVTDNSALAKLASKSATADWDTFSNTTDSLEAIRDASGGGGGGTMAWSDLLVDIDDVPNSAGERFTQLLKAGDAIEVPLAEEEALADTFIQRFMDTPKASYAAASSFGELFNTVFNKLPAGGRNMFGAGDTNTDGDDIAGGSGGSAVAVDVVDDSRTWFATDYRARNIVTVGDGFAGSLALQPDLNPGTTILTVDSVSITGAATVTATNLAVNRAKTRASFTVPALTTTGTYVVVVTVTTIDGQTIPTTATLKVQ